MTVALTVAVILPSVLDSNGDAANARVLAQRARWSGIESVVITALEEDWSLGRAPDVVVIGTGADHDLGAAREKILAHAALLRGWRAQGTEFVAVGVGWELLSEGIETRREGFVSGAGVFPGRAVEAPERVTDDIVVMAAGARFVGFENHRRQFTGLSEGEALGSVRYGFGNGNGYEGYSMDGLLGTHLHGPVLAKNPVLADEILTRVVAGQGGRFDGSDSRIAAADETARAARDEIATRLGLGSAPLT